MELLQMADHRIKEVARFLCEEATKTMLSLARVATS
jgi:hypothetical protein